jgi:hypothetical protein
VKGSPESQLQSPKKAQRPRDSLAELREGGAEQHELIE